MDQQPNRVLQGTGRVGPVAAAPPRERTDVVLSRRPAVPLHAARPAHSLQRRRRRAPGPAPGAGPRVAAGSSSGPACGISGISRCSCPASFPTASNRRAVDVDYYVSMGEYAYGSLSRRDADAFGEVFSELARKFVPYMDVLSDVSEQSGVRSSTGCIAVVREMAENGQSPGRPAPGRPGHSPERLDRSEIPSIASFVHFSGRPDRTERPPSGV